MQSPQIVVIEDDEDIRETFKELLEFDGFSVATAENGKEGLDLLKQIDKPCMILLDLMMPVMNGWEFLEAIKKDEQAALDNIPVTVVSAAADVTSVSQQYGCKVLSKPVDFERLSALAHEYCKDQ